MDGISLDGIMGTLNSFLPTISYIVNLFNKLFDLLTSYLGIEIIPPAEEETEPSTEEIE